MKKCQKFRWREGTPGSDYPLSDGLIEGPPGELKDALEDIASALGFLDPDYFDLTFVAGFLGEALKRHGLAEGSARVVNDTPGGGGISGLKGERDCLIWILISTSFT